MIFRALGTTNLSLPNVRLTERAMTLWRKGVGDRRVSRSSTRGSNRNVKAGLVMSFFCSQSVVARINIVCRARRSGRLRKADA